jgi:hypothetical protein
MAGTLLAENHLTTTATQRYFNVVRRNLEASADAMPAEKYSFQLTPGQMTFAQWLIHSTQRNYSDCATLKKRNPFLTSLSSRFVTRFQRLHEVN